MAKKTTSKKNANTPASAAAASGGDAIERDGEWVSFPCQGGFTHVRGETVDAIEGVSNTECHLVFDGVRLLVHVSADEAFDALTQAE